MRQNQLLRDRLFKVGAYLLVFNVVFYGIWQKIAVNFAPCAGRAIGIEIGLATAILAGLLILFGRGIRLLLLLPVATIVYLWFSWLMWLAQMSC
jgi:hypothetical protein